MLWRSRIERLCFFFWFVMEVAYRKSLFFSNMMWRSRIERLFFSNMIWRSRIELTVAYRKAYRKTIWNTNWGSRIEYFYLFSQRGSVAYSSSLSYHILSYNVKNSWFSMFFWCFTRHLRPLKIWFLCFWVPYEQFWTKNFSHNSYHFASK